MSSEFPHLVTYEQEELFEAMSDISEDCWCAGWLIGTEDAVWRLIHEGGKWGMRTLPRDDHELERIRRAAAAADCWIEWRDDHEPHPVPLAEWRAAHPVA